uniref:MARVEL domain-containing protein n=2 Tax=Dendroctonus ponderosae TaxID=77166 RepID=A0AAR5Q8Z7_DENPD
MAASEAKPLYSTCVAVLGFICFVVGATAVGIPMWGYFGTPGWGVGDDNGYFGPWKTCKFLLYNRERCEEGVSRFRASVAVWVAGLVASIAVVVLGIFCILSVLQLAMINSKEQVVLKYSATVLTKVVMAFVSALLAIVAASLFATQIDDERNGFEVTRGPGFYLEVLSIILNSCLCVMSLYDMFFSRREGGDPTTTSMPVEPTTYGNPGFRDRGTNGGISMTDASGKPYTGASNGSMASMNTTSTTLGSTNGSTVGSSIGTARSPLRSSLKKPKPKDGLGIQNPGFSGTSPTLNRNGSTKKVRIQTHSTEV